MAQHADVGFQLAAPPLYISVSVGEVGDYDVNVPSFEVESTAILSQPGLKNALSQDYTFSRSVSGYWKSASADTARFVCTHATSSGSITIPGVVYQFRGAVVTEIAQVIAMAPTSEGTTDTVLADYKHEHALVMRRDYRDWDGTTHVWYAHPWPLNKNTVRWRWANAYTLTYSPTAYGVLIARK